MKRFFVFLLALAACAALLCAAVGAADVPSNVTWEEIDSEAKLRELGSGTHYARVTENITVADSSHIEIEGTLTLDLNGRTITYEPSVEKCDGKALFYCKDGAKFTLMDGKGGGKLTFAHLGKTYPGTGMEVGQTLYARAYAVAVNKSSTFTMKGGTIENFGNTGAYGAAVYLYAGSADQTPAFYMEGGTIQNCIAHVDGTVASRGSGAAVHMRGAKSKFYMTGGTIQNCSAEGYGGAVYAQGGQISITGGSITGCTSGKSGGAICVTEGSALTIGGSAQIRGNKAPGTLGAGGAIYADSATITMTGGTIENNAAQNAANELYLNGGSFTMSGGKLLHTANAAAWRTVSLRSDAKFSISDGEIELGAEPYAVEIRDTAVLTATGGTVIAEGTNAAFELAGSGRVNPEKAATFARADAETAAFVTYPDKTTYGANKYVKLVPGWTLTLDNNGHGDRPDSIIVPKNYRANIQKLQDTADGYLCTGWYYDQECTRMYEKEPFTEDTTLYAGWVKQGDFGLRISGWKEEDGKNILQYDDVTYGTPEANENQTKTFTIQNIGSETLEVALYTTSGAPHNQFYFERGTKLIQAVELEPGEVRTVYAEYSIPSYYNPLWQDVSKPRIDGPYPITVTAKNDASKTRTYEFYMKRQLIRATASLETPTLATSSYPYGTKLGDIDITPPAGWSWVDGENVRLPAGTTSVQACYTLSDDEKLFYDWSGVEGYDAQTQTVTRDIALTITRGNAPARLFTCTLPTERTYDGNQKLASVTAKEAGSDGCAPTLSQWLMRSASSLTRSGESFASSGL